MDRPDNLLINAECIQALNAGEKIPDKVTVHGGATFPITFHHIDAWRGHYATEAAPGWIKVDDGWVTGDYDDAPPENRGSNVEARLSRLASENPDKTYVLVISPTSNVFAMSYDVFVKES